MNKQFELLKQILDFPIGFVLNVNENGFGVLGTDYQIPVWLMREHTDWFKEI
jgi:hypothetical protein